MADRQPWQNWTCRKLVCFGWYTLHETMTSSGEMMYCSVSVILTLYAGILLGQVGQHLGSVCSG